MGHPTEVNWFTFLSMLCGLFLRTCDLGVQSVLPHDICVPKNHCVMKDCAIKSIELMGEWEVGVEHSKTLSVIH